MKRRGRRVAWRVAGVVIVTLTGSGCSSVGEYANARLLDLWDVVPTSVRAGPGAKVTVTVTRLLGTGIGGGKADAVGMAPGRWGRGWQEHSFHLPILTGVESWYRKYARWPGGPHPYRKFYTRFGHNSYRQFGRTFFVIPKGVGPGGGTPVEEPWHSWANVELDVFLGVGLRVGLCPGELVDFIGGLFGADLLGDDPGGYWDQFYAGDLPPPVQGEDQ